MRPASIPASLLLLATSVAAQNDFMVYPERNGSATTFVTRANGASQRIEVLQEVPAGLFAGVGDGGLQSLVFGMFAWVTDEDSTTAEQYELVIRRGAPGGGPDPSVAGEVLRVGPFSTPTRTPSVRLTTQARHTFPPVVLPSTAPLYFGVDLYAANNWPTGDGLSVWAAFYNPPASRATHGDNPRPGAPNLAWNVDAGAAASSTSPMTFRMGLSVAAPVLNIGGIDPNNTRQTPTGSSNYGAGGLYPVVTAPPGRNDGHDLRIESRLQSNATALGFFGLQLSPVGPIAVRGIAGNLWLDPTILVPVGSVPLAGGIGTLRVFLPGTIPVAVVGQRVFYQALVVGGGGISFTNAQGIDF